MNGRLLLLLRCLFAITFCLLSVCVKSQAIIDTLPDTLSLSVGIAPRTDSLSFENDTIPSDSSQKTNENGKRLSKGAIEKLVTYDAKDSIVVDIKNRMAYLFGEAVVYYEDLELHADFIQLGFASQELYACGVADSAGNMHGYPVFKQGETFFRAHELKYNFQTTKGIITQVITEEGDGYIHGEKVKKLDDNTSFIRHGKYTTCELDHPHFEIAFTKAKVMPNDKIVTGPAYLSFGGVPTFFALPFGYFPIKKGRRSGIIMPTFGETNNRGFYLENFGYYFGISDNIDLVLAGDIYTNGSWAAKVRSNYVVRYKCTGAVNISFAQNFFGERYTPSRYHTNDFKLYWDHKQDAKSHPTTRFSAHVNIVSLFYNKYNASSVNDYLSNQYTSKLNLSTSVKGIFFADITASYNQNTKTGQMDFLLPDISMSVNQFYPFRKKNKTSALKWWDNISLKWSSQFTNKIATQDSMILKAETWEKMQLGWRHNIPLTIPIKIAKLINWNTTVSLTEKWYLQSEEQQFVTDTTDDVVIGHVNNVFHRNFYALHDLNITTGLTTKVYFMYQFKKGGLLAIRHVMSPDLSFSYIPNLSGNTFGEYFNTITGQWTRYSYFANSIFGGVSDRSSAIAKISISNNIEMKVRSRKDTITGTKKIVLIENLTLSEYYDFAADSMNWSMFTISGRTTLFKQLYITFSLGFDPYCYNAQGVRINRTELKENKRLLRLSSTDVTIGLNWTLNQEFFKGKNEKKEKKQQEQQPELFTENTLGMPTHRPDFNTPWSLTINYSFAYTSRDNPYFYMSYNNLALYDILMSEAEKSHIGRIIQTINVSGEFNITKKWKIGFTTGYDITNRDISYTSIDIYRDLHCWEMRFNFIPFGPRRGWSFTLNVKASVLQDLKIPLKHDFRENL